jgi:hypothetical protein
MFDFLRALIHFFETYDISYMLSGSMGMSIYTGPRYTRDYDFIVHLKPSDVLPLTKYFNEGYYYDEDSIKEAINEEGQFNIIDHKSNYKADFIILRNNEFEITKFERRIQVYFLDLKIYVISAEDLLLSKLVWIQELQSALQSNDIIELAKLNNLDWHYMWTWIDKLKLNTFGLIKK